MRSRRPADKRLRDAFEANAPDLLAYLERRIEPRVEAADVLSETMVIAWKKVTRLPDSPSEARMWLFALAKNALLNHRRALGRYSAAVDRLRSSLIEDGAAEGQEAALEQSELRQALDRALKELDSRDAELVRLINWDGFSLAEVARLEGVAASTVRSRYASALRKLEAILPSDLAPEPEEVWQR